MGSGTAKEDRQGRVKMDGHSRLPSDFCMLINDVCTHMTTENRRPQFLLKVC